MPGYSLDRAAPMLRGQQAASLFRIRLTAYVYVKEVIWPREKDIRPGFRSRYGRGS